MFRTNPAGAECAAGAKAVGSHVHARVSGALEDSLVLLEVVALPIDHVSAA